MLWLGLHLPHDILGPKTAVRVPGSQTDCEADPGRCRLEMIEYADVLLGRVVAELDDPDDWVIFFIGDNGQTQTAPWPPISCPNLQAKNSITECGVNVPLVVGYGGIAESRPAPTTDALTMGVDIFSTVLDLAGVSWAAKAAIERADRDRAQPTRSSSAKAAIVAKATILDRAQPLQLVTP